MRKLFLILTIVCFLVTLTVLTAVPVSADHIETSLTITPPKPVKINEPILRITVSVPITGDKGLSKADEVNPYLDYGSPVSPDDDTPYAP
jgi:hypothetical protein